MGSVFSSSVSGVRMHVHVQNRTTILVIDSVWQRCHLESTWVLHGRCCLGKDHITIWTCGQLLMLRPVIEQSPIGYWLIGVPSERLRLLVPSYAAGSETIEWTDKNQDTILEKLKHSIFTALDAMLIE